MATEVDEFEITDVLDGEFQAFLDLTKTLVRELNQQEDREICARYIRKCCLLNSPILEVKLNRNKFFKYFLEMLQSAVGNQMELPEEDSPAIPVNQEREIRHWGPDKRSYVAMKLIPGFGCLIYMASTDKPQLGWEEYGFSEGAKNPRSAPPTKVDGNNNQ